MRSEESRGGGSGRRTLQGMTRASCLPKVYGILHILEMRVSIDDSVPAGPCGGEDDGIGDSFNVAVLQVAG